MDASVYSMIVYFAIFIGFVPLLLYKIRGKANIEASYMQPMVWLLFFSSAYELVGTIALKIDSDVWFRLYILLEFFCLLYLFAKVFGKKFKWLLVLFSVLFISGFVVSLFVWNSIEHLKTDSYLAIIQTIFIYVFAFLWFKDIFSNAVVTSLWETPLFYFFSAFILYYSGTIFLFLVSDAILNTKEINFEKYWILNVAFTLLLRILIIIGIWKGQKRLTPYSG